MTKTKLNPEPKVAEIFLVKWKLVKWSYQWNEASRTAFLLHRDIRTVSKVNVNTSDLGLIHAWKMNDIPYLYRIASLQKFVEFKKSKSNFEISKKKSWKRLAADNSRKCIIIFKLNNWMARIHTRTRSSRTDKLVHKGQAHSGRIKMSM